MNFPDLPPRTAPPARLPQFAATAALLAVLTLLPACSQESSSSGTAGSAGDAIIARVNGVDIRQSDLVLAEEDVGAEMAAASP
jgi:hypothetical protein